MNPDLIILFVAFSLFGIELIFLKIKKREISLDQTILNLGLGMIERLIGILTINFGLYFFTFLIPWRFIDPFGPPWDHLGSSGRPLGGSGAARVGPRASSEP